MSRSQVTSTPQPSGDTSPRPVTTTRFMLFSRPIRLLPVADSPLRDASVGSIPWPVELG